MKRTAGRLVAAAVLLTASACGGSSPDGNPLVAQLQGTWESLCEPGPSGSGSSDKGIGTYSGREYSSGLRNYGNETCSGTGGALRFGATYRISNVGSPVTVNLGSTPVTAYPVDWEHHYYDRRPEPALQRRSHHRRERRILCGETAYSAQQHDLHGEAVAAPPTRGRHLLPRVQPEGLPEAATIRGLPRPVGAAPRWRECSRTGRTP
jgi:hypothetical protein